MKYGSKFHIENTADVTNSALEEEVSILCTLFYSSSHSHLKFDRHKRNTPLTNRTATMTAQKRKYIVMVGDSYMGLSTFCDVVLRCVS